jgi:formylglycine-generating enzyme required for sulfatase activity
MGSPAGELGRNGDETEHEVTLTRNFQIMSTEVIQEMYETLMGWNPSANSNCNFCPVEKVSWYDAVAYTNELSISAGLPVCTTLTNVQCSSGASAGTSYLACMSAGQGGINQATVSLNGIASIYDCEGYRLPTEAEWERAVRAGSPSAFYNGGISQTGCVSDPKLSEIGHYCWNSSETAEVGALMPNNWGLFDMSGNVYEWTWDWYAAYPGDETDPVGAASGASRVRRGGGWDYAIDVCRSASRSPFAPSLNGGETGFRVTRSLP